MGVLTLEYCQFSAFVSVVISNVTQMPAGILQATQNDVNDVFNDITCLCPAPTLADKWLTDFIDFPVEFKSTA